LGQSTFPNWNAAVVYATVQLVTAAAECPVPGVVSTQQKVLLLRHHRRRQKIHHQRAVAQGKPNVAYDLNMNYYADNLSLQHVLWYLIYLCVRLYC